jgi:predicted site-specific integrase-resolvase
MKLSAFAKNEGIAYLTAYRWWRLGYLNGKQAASGTILIDEKHPMKEINGVDKKAENDEKN